GAMPSALVEGRGRGGAGLSWPTYAEGVDATMVFKRLLGSLGVGGPPVDTVLDPAPVRPGGTLTGQVRLQGGNAGFDIEHITLELVARVEAEHDGGES